MAQKIYTKTGDGGNTALIGGTKVPKSDLRIETYGTVDELNSWLGLVNDQLEDAEVKLFLKEIQDRLFTIGSSLATDAEREPKMKLPDLHAADVEALEKSIDIDDRTAAADEAFYTARRACGGFVPACGAVRVPAGGAAGRGPAPARPVCRRPGDPLS